MRACRLLFCLAVTSLATMVAGMVAPEARAQDSGDDPAKGNFTLEEAVKGVPGPAKGSLTASIETNQGKFTCTFFEKQAPITVANFVGLARGVRPWKDPKSGQWVKKPFFDGLIFHRVIPGFMIQGGDPLGTGIGNPGYKFQNETPPELKFDKPGLLAMANAGPNTNGSQFFITEGTPQQLNGGYSIFGQCDPVALVGKIARGPRNGERPNPDVVIQKVVVKREPPAKRKSADK
jgi:peptidyl-prolyl cis-trans isomerase A (cyclophilin A)